MIPEIGHFALLLCLPIALMLATIPLLGAVRGNRLWMNAAPIMAAGQWLFLLISFCCLSSAFLTDDFSVKLVAMHSNSKLPGYFKFSALWGNHEGSLLLWVFILSSWTLAVACFSRQLPDDIRARVLSVLGMISLGFLAFVIFTSNPFERLLLNPVAEGRDLNPLLQDIGLIIHPPMLYIGYVGFAVAFAFAITALMTEKLDAAWARWSRPWTNIAWAFLTVGIALGSWWAYYELGWGGWWFWDPVENASFMPWLAGTALVHSLAATEKRGVFRSWTLLLAILAFSLSLLGTFLVRSGILVSVHAFASDPTRGIFILALLVIVIGSSLLLYALKAPAMRSAVRFNGISRETLLLANNALLTVALATVLLGTLFPLFMKALNAGSYSVGPPYFNSMFIPIMIPVLILMGIAPYIHWKQTRISSVQIRPWVFSLSAAILFSVIGTIYMSSHYDHDFSWAAALTIALSTWITVTTGIHLILKSSHQEGIISGMKRLAPSYWGMCIAHFGIAITALGIGLTSVYSEQRDVRMEVGQSISLGSYRYQLVDIRGIEGANYRSTQATINVYMAEAAGSSDKTIAVLLPEKRLYYATKNVMTEAAIDPRLTRDLYVALGEQLDDGVWAMRIHVKPFVRCIWLGTLFMALGGVIAVADKRYRKALLSSKPKTLESVNSAASATASVDVLALNPTNENN